MKNVPVKAICTGKIFYRIIEPQRSIGGLIFLGGGVDYDIEHCHVFSYFLPNLQLNIGKKYLKTAKIIDESLIFAIVLRNYSTKPSYTSFYDVDATSAQS
jgi:hypothetical protein